MFTGIIRHIGTVLGAAKSTAGKRLTIDVGPLAAGMALGDSIAVSGACLTASEIKGNQATFDAVAETLSRTTLGSLARGARVNLERALALGQTLDGHLVQGHVDGQAAVTRIRRGHEHVIEFRAGPDLTALMVPKGSVAIDGVSLTLIDVQAGGFSVAIIPTTLGETTLSALKAGDKVNVETDIIGKYVRKFLGNLAGPRGEITMDKLREEGFL